MFRKLSLAGVAGLMVLASAAPALAAPKVGFGDLFYDGDVVRTVVPPAAMPQAGVDDFFVVMNGEVAGQLGIAAVAPGDPGYHGGKWAFHSVTWNEGATQVLLRSADDVALHYNLGHLTVDRQPEKDFKCPIQP